MSWIGSFVVANLANSSADSGIMFPCSSTLAYTGLPFSSITVDTGLPFSSFKAGIGLPSLSFAVTTAFPLASRVAGIVFPSLSKRGTCFPVESVKLWIGSPFSSLRGSNGLPSLSVAITKAIPFSSIAVPA
jgi:hypothetical protein